MKYLEPADFPVNRVEKSPLVPIFAESRVSQNAFPVKRMMRRVLFWRQSQQWLVILLAAVFASPAFCQVDASTMLEVKGSRAYLFTEPEGRSQVVAELEPGEKLVPLVNVIGSGESWYWVKTQEGTVGWVKASDVQGADHLEKPFSEEYDSFPPQDIKSGQLRSERAPRIKGRPPIPPGNPDLLYSTCPPPPRNDPCGNTTPTNQCVDTYRTWTRGRIQREIAKCHLFARYNIAPPLHYLYGQITRPGQRIPSPRPGRFIYGAHIDPTRYCDAQSTEPVLWLCIGFPGTGAGWD